jgi:hypothetical protein
MSAGTPPPPPPPPGYGPPPPGYGAPPPPYGTPGSAPQNGMGTTALIMGILQFVCLGPIGSILAIIFGVIGAKKAKQGLATNGGMAKAGMWLGIIGIVISVIATIALVASGAWIFKAASESLDPINNTKTGLADGSYAMDPTANVHINDRCSFTGVAVSTETVAESAGSVTIVGQGPTRCGPGTRSPRVFAFTVSGGTAVITAVE